MDELNQALGEVNAKPIGLPRRGLRLMFELHLHATDRLCSPDIDQDTRPENDWQ